MEQTKGISPRKRLPFVARWSSIATVGIILVAAVAVRGASTPGLTATLVSPEKKAPQKTATVEVNVTGIELVDPDQHAIPAAGQGHLHYQLDNGAVIATTASKLSFHDLPVGQHTILVILAANDHKPLGPQEKLTFTIPQ